MWSFYFLFFTKDEVESKKIFHGGSAEQNIQVIHPVIHCPQAPKKNKRARAEHEGMTSSSAWSDCAGAFPCTLLQDLCALLPCSGPLLAPCTPGPGQAPCPAALPSSQHKRQPSSQQRQVLCKSVV